MYWCEFLVEGTKLLRPRRKKLTSLAYLIIINVAFNFAHILKFQPIILTKPKQHHKLITNLETYKLSTKNYFDVPKILRGQEAKKLWGSVDPLNQIVSAPVHDGPRHRRTFTVALTASLPGEASCWFTAK